MSQARPHHASPCDPATGNQTGPTSGDTCVAPSGREEPARYCSTAQPVLTHRGLRDHSPEAGAARPSPPPPLTLLLPQEEGEGTWPWALTASWGHWNHNMRLHETGEPLKPGPLSCHQPPHPAAATHCRMNWMASSYFIPLSMSASATRTGALGTDTGGSPRPLLPPPHPPTGRLLQTHGPRLPSADSCPGSRLWVTTWAQTYFVPALLCALGRARQPLCAGLRIRA